MRFYHDATERGFELLWFEDGYGEICDIQRSSAADGDYVWVGIHDPHPQILASRVESGGTGWVDYEMPKDVLIKHRMHLSREQSIGLALRLLIFGVFNKI